MRPSIKVFYLKLSEHLFMRIGIMLKDNKFYKIYYCGFNKFT